jgi:ferredoxin
MPDARSVVIDPDGDAIDAVRAAVDGCPTAAIRLDEQIRS